MTIREKFLKIIEWYSEITKEESKQLSQQKNFDRIKEITLLVGESLPEDLLILYHHFDGDKGSGHGSFFGHSLISLEEMKNSLAFAKTQVKPENPRISNPKNSDVIIDKLIKTVVEELPLKKSFGFTEPKWNKVEFECSAGSMSGPYFYPNLNTTNREREVIRLSDGASNDIYKFAKQLHELEFEDYNWDTLKITAYGNGEKEVNRIYYDFDNQLRLTSTPEGAIKKKYFHIKWIPLISDYGGNYIGMDLDPDDKGIKGQIIIFGRDEEDMYVLSNSLNEFLDFNIKIINKGGEVFKTQSHLHAIYKKLKALNMEL